MAKKDNPRQWFREMSDKALIDVAATVVVNRAENLEAVSPRTERTRRIGAFELALALSTEDRLARGDYERAAVGEFLARAVSNARSQGIIVPTLKSENPILETPTEAHHKTCEPDMVDFPIPGLE